MAKTKVTGEYLKDSVVRFTAKAGENITKGNAVYISGISGELPVVSLADADDTAKMPAFGLAEATVLTNAEVEVTSFGTLANLDTSSYTLGDILYVGTTAGALTNDPAGLEATKLQNIGIVQRVHASNGSIKVGGAGRTNAVPNLDNGDIFIGNSDNKAVSSALSTEIESYLDGGTSTPTFASLKIETSTGGELILSSSDTAQAVDQFIAGLAFKTADASAPSLVPHYAGIKGVAGDVYGNQTLEFYSGRDRYEAGTNPNMVILGDTTGTDGNVGINKSDPSYKLDVSGTIHSSNSGTDGGQIRLTNTGGGSTWYWAARTTGLNLGELTVADANLFIKNGGNVGIGIENPSNKLTVKAASGSNGGIELYHNNNNKVAELVHHGSGDEGRLSLYDGGTGTVQLHGETGQPSYINSGNFLFNTTGTAGSDLSDGGILFRNDSNTYMQIASGTESDTSLLYFYKKSGTGIAGVGDIKAMGNDVAINSTDEGRLHVGGTGRYSWSNTLFGPQNDNARDLGSSGARWKDAHLSGNLYCGGQIELPINSSIWMGNTADSGHRLRLHGTSTGNSYIDWGEAGSLYFRSGQNTSANRMSLDSSGNLTLYGGALYVGGTAAANALDDYEEGTWTSSIHGSTASTVTFTSGYYTKIGNMVFANFALSVNSQANGDNFVSISGPFVQHQNNITWTGYCTNYNYGDRRSGIIINNSSGNNTQWFVGWSSNSTAAATIRGVIVYQTT